MGALCSPAPKPEPKKPEFEPEFRKLFDATDPISEEKKQELKEKYKNDWRVQHMLKEPDYSAQEIVDIDRVTVRNMEPKFANLRSVLERAFQNIKQHNIEHAILVIGNTGCGKSTLLSSLVYGPDVLEEVFLEMTGSTA